VLLIKWNLETDHFEMGQWFKVRIYEKRCDLSPDGDLLIYFAASQKKPFVSWTAVSRPPYLTALALWKKGDCWGGGGQFQTGAQIRLNHRENQMDLAPDFSVPKWLSVAQFGDHSGWGEDDPIWSNRLERDGWIRTGYPEREERDSGAKMWLKFDPPITWEKVHPLWPRKYTLRMSILGLHERNGPWDIIEHHLFGLDGRTEMIGRSDWADWSPNGDLLFAQSGCLYRLRHEKGKFGPVETSEEIADFSKLKFENRAPTEEAQHWLRKRRKARDK